MNFPFVIWDNYSLRKTCGHHQALGAREPEITRDYLSRKYPSGGSKFCTQTFVNFLSEVQTNVHSRWCFCFFSFLREAILEFYILEFHDRQCCIDYLKHLWPIEDNIDTNDMEENLTYDQKLKMKGNNTFELSCICVCCFIFFFCFTTSTHRFTDWK